MSQPAPTIFGSLAYPLAHAVLPTCRVGPYLHGTDQWWIIAEEPDATTGPNLVAYKSTDAGVTRTRIIAGPLCANSPGSVVNGAAAYVVPGLGTQLSIGYQDAAGMLNAISFDMATELFGTANPSGVVIPLGSLGNLAHQVQPSGDLTLIYYQTTLAVFAVTYRGSPAMWHGPLEVDDGSTFSPALPNWFFENISLISTGNIMVLYGRGSGGAFRFGSKLWAIYDGTSVISRGTTPLPAGNVGPNNIGDTGLFCAPLYDSVSDRVVFPLSRVVVVGVENRPAISLLIGHTSAAPTWTVVDLKVYTLTEPAVFADSVDQVNVTGNTAGTHFDVFWFFQPNLSRHFTVQQSSASSLLGPWSSPSLYYDENTAQPTPPAFLIGLQPIYVRTLASGAVGVSVGLVVTSPAFWRGTMYSWGSSTPPPPTGATIAAVQVITGGAGTPTTITATGPTTTSGVGGFSATAVAIGTYVLSQAPVAGFIAGVFVLSGTGGTLVGNILTVADGASVTVTITNTFTGGALSASCPSSTITKGVPYDSSIRVTGGVPPYTFAVSGLPPGLTLNTSTGQITGTPTDDSPFTFTYTVAGS